MTQRNELYHHGVLGMKWGVRRYQNPDGTLIHPKRSRKSPGLLDNYKKKRAIRKQENAEYKQFKKSIKTADFHNRQRVEDEYQNRLRNDSTYRKLRRDADTSLMNYKRAAALDNTTQSIINQKNRIKEDPNPNPNQNPDSNPNSNPNSTKPKYRDDSLLDMVARTTTETNRRYATKQAEEKAHELTKYEQKAGQNYVRKMNEATLRDLHYTDSYEKGMKYLHRAKLDYYVDSNGNITNRRILFKTHKVDKPDKGKYDRYDPFKDNKKYHMYEGR